MTESGISVSLIVSQLFVLYSSFDEDGTNSIFFFLIH